MGEPNNISSSWLTVDGQVVSPDAPAGGGGAGSFRTAAGSLGVDDPFIPALPSPDAPAARYVDPTIPLDTNDPPAPKKNPPPPLIPSTTDVLVLSDELYDIDVKLVVPVASIDPNVGDGGETFFNDDRVGEPTYPVYTQVDGKITAFSGKFALSGFMTAQVTFEKTDSKGELSAYGRGTTKEDVANGDITLGFHESCHVNDFKTWPKTHPLPVPKFKIGMTTTAFNTEVAKFKSAYSRWIADIIAFSKAQTDEVGNPTLTQYQARNKKTP